MRSGLSHKGRGRTEHADREFWILNQNLNTIARDAVCTTGGRPWLTSMDLSWRCRRRTLRPTAAWQGRPARSGASMARWITANGWPRTSRSESSLVPAQRQAQAGRDGGVLLDHLQIPRAARPRQRQGDGRQAAYRHDGHKVAAVRRQAHDLWRGCVGCYRRETEL